MTNEDFTTRAGTVTACVIIASIPLAVVAFGLILALHAEGIL